MPKAVVYEGNREIQQTLFEHLKSLGFECLITSNNQEALEMIGLEDVILVIVGDEGSQIIKQISSFPMYRRREIIVFLLSNSISTNDRLSAFAQGVDFIVNLKDLNNFPMIFKKYYIEHQKSYKIFKETLAK